MGTLVVYFTEAVPVSGPRQVCECERIEVTSSGGARDHVPSCLGIFDKVGTLNPGTYEASYYQSQSNKFLGIKTIFVDPDTDPYSWIVTDSLMGFNAMITNSLYTGLPCPHDVLEAGCTLMMVSGERMT